MKIKPLLSYSYRAIEILLILSVTIGVLAIGINCHDNAEMGWDIGEDIRPHAYTKQEWFDGPHAMFYYNVEEDKQVLYGTK